MFIDLWTTQLIIWSRFKIFNVMIAQYGIISIHKQQYDEDIDFSSSTLVVLIKFFVQVFIWQLAIKWWHANMMKLLFLNFYFDVQWVLQFINGLYGKDICVRTTAARNVCPCKWWLCLHLFLKQSKILIRLFTVSCLARK
jgi:hypothetical protein